MNTTVSVTSANSIYVDKLVVEHRTGDGPIRALNGADLTVTGGSSVAVMGPSGCGKSTLLGVLAGLATPTSGVVRIGEIDLGAMSDGDRGLFRRQHMGVVYQADNLLPFLTVAENVLLPLSLSRTRAAGFDARASRTHVEALLARLGLDRHHDRLPDELSGGQRQRVAVARAVVHRPSVILADEPTAGLDDANGRRVVELLVDLQLELAATLVLVTHDVDIARSMQRVVALRDGATVGQEIAAMAGKGST